VGDNLPVVNAEDALVTLSETVSRRRQLKKCACYFVPFIYAGLHMFVNSHHLMYRLVYTWGYTRRPDGLRELTYILKLRCLRCLKP
jgi:hypothetical protein